MTKLPTPRRPSPPRPRALMVNLQRNPATRRALERAPGNPLMARALERALANPRKPRAARTRRALNLNLALMTRRAPKDRTSDGGCATAKRPWRRRNATACTMRPTPGRGARDDDDSGNGNGNESGNESESESDSENGNENESGHYSQDTVHC